MRKSSNAARLTKGDRIALGDKVFEVTGWPQRLGTGIHQVPLRNLDGERVSRRKFNSDKRFQLV